VRVYAIWTVKLTFDARDQWDGGGLTDPRVIHLWDQQDLVGDWFVAHLPANQANDWDAYWLFGSTATWTTATTPDQFGQHGHWGEGCAGTGYRSSAQGVVSAASRASS